MYEHNERQMIMPDEFFLPFGGRLNPNNRWAVMANLIPWSKLEDEYVQLLNDSTRGNKAYSVRTALGALIIKERLGLSDRETVEQITENPYLQYFIGLSSFQEEAPFHASTMTYFRKRLDASIVNQVNEWIVEEQTKRDQDDDDDSDNDHKGTGGSHGDKSNQGTADSLPNQGKLMMDATCAPADIAYPTDLNLLNQAREKLEAMIDTLHEPLKGERRKPRTYRKKARKAYLAISKQKQPGRKNVRQAVGKQLNYVQRNLKHISFLVQQVGLSPLDKRQYGELLVIQELTRQQQHMYDHKKHQIDHRIVSIHQPHVRPIVRGKTDANVEFGAKISVSMINGYTTLDKLSWDAYHEGVYLQDSIEAYCRRHGTYPEAVLADQIYRTRGNRRYCKERGIRLSGPKLGRPSKNAQENRLQKQIEYQDAAERNAIEGKFGEGKRSYGLGLISACLRVTSETVISIQFLVMNLEKILRDTFLYVLYLMVE
ncbi:IS5 family transposase, partial [Lentibacillus halophilus]|uniref:IS5 family transposase n=1 Tax=Lentibacillus halophilus TaxID=295065 RepID=UPI0031DCA2B5